MTISGLLPTPEAVNQEGYQVVRGKQIPRLGKVVSTFSPAASSCQTFSAAGLRLGTADDRYLWPEMFRVIKLTKAEWIIAENVRGLLTWNEGLVLERVCADLEAAGYAVWPVIIPALAVNAPHRRDRVWIIANRQGAIPAPNGTKPGLEGRSQKQSGYAGQRDRTGWHERPDWNQNWLEIATKLCGVDDGLPARLDGFELSKPQHRQQRLKSLGNAIVPQVAIEIMKGLAI